MSFRSKRYGDYRIEKEGQYYKVIPVGKRKPIARFLMLYQAEKFIDQRS